MAEGTKGMLKVPLIIAAVVIVSRIVLELVGSPESVNQIFGVAWLHLLFPIYFGFRIASAGVAKPFMALLKSLLAFNVYTRLMVLPTYWLAYALQWKAVRFSFEGGGNVGPDVTPLAGWVGIPLRNFIAWVIATTIMGMIIGGVTLLIRRRGAK